MGMMYWLIQALCLWSTTLSALAIGNERLRVNDTEALQDLVTFDEHSIFVRGERIMFFSGEIHPWRLPSPDLWLDVFQKMKALGFTGAGFYVNWALLEGNPGHFTAEGVFSYERFFEAASEAGIYLLARPGPYINAEVSGGGFPGWLQNEESILRTNQSGFIEATANYISHIGKIIADAQITNGGPVVLLQPENEYTYGADWVKWPDRLYIETVNQQYRDAGVVVPFVNNEAAVIGLFTPGDRGGPDIYGHDSYPSGFDCSDPLNWTKATLYTNWDDLHQEQSPSTPYTIPEFQGGALDSLGGVGLDGCATLTNQEFARLFFKNNYSFGVKVLSLYMLHGGTNWGNIGQPGAYASYDYGAAIRENRMIDREKYAELKLQAQFITSSPAYLTARLGNETNTTYVSTPEITTTPLFGEHTTFFVTRHSDFRTLQSTEYMIEFSTSAGNVTVPQLGGSLVLNGRDSKIHVVDYDVSGINLVYSTADIMTHGISSARRTLLMYGGAGETHELAFASASGEPDVEGGDVKVQTKGHMTVVQWEVTPTRKVLHYDGLDVFLMWRNEAYDIWSLELEAPAPIGNYSSMTKESVVVKAGYLMRSASRSAGSLYLTGDINGTTDIEVISGYGGEHCNHLYFNGKELEYSRSENGHLLATVEFSPPELNLPNMSALDWRYIDSLPEIQDSYDDSSWTLADIEMTSPKNYDENGTLFEQMTPMSLLSGDYGYHIGSLVYRGHFTATGAERTLNLTTQGGRGHGHSVWLGSTFLGSFGGGKRGSDTIDPFDSGGSNVYTMLYNITESLTEGDEYVLTVVIDYMGTETNWTPGLDMMKTPRGIMNYTLSSHDPEDITWRLTGNLGGEGYRDLTRGPLNEGAMFAERNGYHYPNPPSAEWESRSPLVGIDAAGIAFYTANFTLELPTNYDVPLSFLFNNSGVPFSSSIPDYASMPPSATGPRQYRVQLFVNGWQMGEYLNQLGPQTRFPVPEGILDYRGENTVAMTFWAQEEDGAKLDGFELVADGVVETGMTRPRVVESPTWSEREGAY